MEHRRKNEGLLPEPQTSMAVIGPWKKGYLQVSGVIAQWRWMGKAEGLKPVESAYFSKLQ